MLTSTHSAQHNNLPLKPVSITDAPFYLEIPNRVLLMWFDGPVADAGSVEECAPIAPSGELRLFG